MKRTASRNRAPARQVRIIGGDYRRTPLAVIDAPGLRPTPDRVRETLFNWLAHFWDNDFGTRRILDLFAGTGALGLEAASRGAPHVTLVEADIRAVRLLRQSCAKLQATGVQVVHGDARRFVNRADTPAGFDLILLDPPFGENWLPELLAAAPRLLAEKGLVYVESEAPVTVTNTFEILRSAKAGAVHFYLLRRRNDAETQHDLLHCKNQ